MIDMITICSIIKNFLIIVLAFYISIKFSNIKNISKNKFSIIILVSFIIATLFIFLKPYFDITILLIIIYFIFSFFLEKILKTKMKLSLIIGFSLNFIFYTISVTISYFVCLLLNTTNYLFNLIIIFIFQIIIVLLFCKLKRFKNGLNFLKNQNDFIDLIIINICSIIIFVYSISGIYYNDETSKNILLFLLILGLIMFIVIQKTLILSYKQKQLERTVKDYENEIKEKDKIIERKTEENFRYNKLNHEFYGRLKSLEITVEDLIKENKFNSEIGEELMVDINNMTKEYSNKQKKSKSLDKLPKTEILEIDNMFYYMQTEADKKNIDFNLQITGNIYYMINNIIPKNLLVTLIGDHLKDAIIAIDSSDNTYKNILTILGINNDIYELCIYDSGIEFEIDTLLNLGLKPVTTHSKTGGSGIGFITTFETLNKTKASLIIEEKHPISKSDYTKAVRIRFDNKNEYKIISYRAEEIRKKAKDNRIKIENL